MALSIIKATKIGKIKSRIDIKGTTKVQNKQLHMGFIVLRKSFYQKITFRFFINYKHSFMIRAAFSKDIFSISLELNPDLARL